MTTGARSNELTDPEPLRLTDPEPTAVTAEARQGTPVAGQALQARTVNTSAPGK